MRLVDPSEVDLPVGEIRSVVGRYPVRFAILFGSHGRGDATTRSDVDVAVAFEALQPGDDGYNAALFGLSADLCAVLDSDDVDVLDVETAPPGLARRIFEDGRLLAGDENGAEALRRRYRESIPDRSPRERFEDAMDRIDEHLA